MNGKKLGFILLLVSMLAFSQAVKADRSAEEAAVAASQAWVILVDQGNYSGSWEEAAEYFRAAVTMEQWQRSMRAFREPLGGVLSRRLKFKQYTNTLPGAPDGEYVVVQYETSFENKKSAVETIHPCWIRMESGGSQVTTSSSMALSAVEVDACRARERSTSGVYVSYYPARGTLNFIV